MARTKKWLLILALVPLLGAGQQNMGPGRHRTVSTSGGGSPSYISGSYAVANNTLGSSGLTLSITCSGGEFVSISTATFYHNVTGHTLTSTNSNTVTSAGNFYNPSAAAMQNFYISSCNAGSATLTLTAAGGTTGTNALIMVSRYTGLTSNSLDISGTPTNVSSNSPTCAVSANHAGELLVPTLVNYAQTPTTFSSLASGFNQRSTSSSVDYFYGDNLSSSSGTNTFSATASVTTTWECMMVAYK